MHVREPDRPGEYRSHYSLTDVRPAVSQHAGRDVIPATLDHDMTACDCSHAIKLTLPTLAIVRECSECITERFAFDGNELFEPFDRVIAGCECRVFAIDN